MVRKTALKKDFYRELSKTRGRFMSILLIVMLGVAFFSGLRSTEPDMRLSGDAYFDRTKLYDGRIVSTMGLTEDDLDAVSRVSSVDSAEGIHSIDVLCKVDEVEQAFHVLDIPSKLNAVTVTEGRMPENPGECLADAELVSRMGLKVGDVLSLESGNDGAVTDTLATDTYTVVGLASTPVYISFSRGYTTIGTGSLYGFLFVPDSDFTQDYYTEIDYTVKGAADAVCFTDKYDNIASAAASDMEGIADERCEARRDGLVNEAEKKIADAEAELADSKAEADSQLADAAQKISDNESKLESAASKIANGRTEIENAKNTLTEKQEELNTANDVYTDGQAQLTQAKAQLQTLKDNYQLMKQNPNADAQTLARMEGTINAAETQISEKSTELDTAAETIAAGQAEIDSGWETISTQESSLDDAEVELTEGQAELAQGKADYEQAASDAAQQLDDGQKKIDESKAKIADIALPSWTCSDRMDDSDYSGYGDNTERMGKIAQVFPFVFFLVAALISLTMMTRMVEEERIQIGTLKALGYRKADIAWKYIRYALEATVIGSIVGVLIGEKIFPWIVITSYGIMYHYISDHIILYNLSNGFIAGVAAVFCTIGATVISCYSELKAVPAQLMRPPAPKGGKRILLERIPFIWKLFNFTWKSTIRNLARYKKRFFMTVFGIGGSMALILTGFGLRDSIMGVVTIQYNAIQLYDADLYLKDDVTQEQTDALGDYIDQELGSGNYLESYQKEIDLTGGSGSQKVILLVPKNTEDLRNFVDLHSRTTGEKYNLTDDGVVLTEKAARLLNVKAGDTVMIGKNGPEVQVSAVCENYLNHYVYMTTGLYSRLYGEAPSYDDIMVRMDGMTAGEREDTGRNILEQPGVLSINYLAMLEDRLSDMLGVLDRVIVVLTISAGMLTFIVLYSLNSINIEERRRELATIKVLGFYDKELAAYIYRENILLSIVGIGLGVLFGILLHHYLITTVEIDMVMFGRNINASSYLRSIVLTGVFAAIVNFVMFFKLKKINMVESLKSVE